MLHTWLRAALVVLLCACSNRDKAPSTEQTGAPVPPTRGELLTSGDGMDQAARAEREARARAARLARLRSTLEASAPEDLWQRGDKMEQAQNFADAARAFTALVVHHPGHAYASRAAMRAMTAHFQNLTYGDGLTVAEDALTLIDDPIARARLQRVVGNAYLSIPHHGTERGGSFLRGQWLQGRQVQTYRTDRDRAVRHLEAARQAFLEHEGAGVELDERVAVTFDLVSALSRFTPFDASWSYWWYAWPESADDDKVDEQGADERADEWYRSWQYDLSQRQPRGLEVGEDGRIVFTERPDSYREDAGTTAKIKYLLHEVVTLDSSADRHLAAQALLRQALLFRARDGVERLQRLESYWWNGVYPYQREIAGRELHTLADDQVLGLVATHLQVYRVPEDESFPALINEIQARYPDTDAADQAGLLLGQFYQSRAQYDRARKAYEAHIARYPKGNHAASSRAALELLGRSELAIVEMGVQPAGRKASLNVKFRNLDGVRFQARKVDMDALTDAFKQQYRDGRRAKQWGTHVPEPHQLGWYLYGDQDGALARYARTEGPTFEHRLAPDPSGRYAEATLATPLDEPGLYVIQAFPPADGKQSGKPLGTGFVLIEGIAQIAKRGKDGGLLWLVDADTGAPLAGAEVEVFEYWNDWQDQEIIFHSRVHRRTADPDGLVALGADLRQHITVVKHGGRTSYTGYGYGHGRHHAAYTSDATTALVVTDRPVYRPGETVDIKVWAREKRQGEYRPATDVQRIRVRVHDPQGNQLQDEEHTADEFGSVHVKQNLEANAPLGMYRVDIEVDGQWTHTGGNQFRVEEYKAPEFTVSVDSAGQARLGEKVPVAIRADYLFGGPVTDGRVRYRVYRQDHHHEYAVPGVWDWLYQPGYGRCFYNYHWLGWWREVPVSRAVWYPWWGPPPEPEKELIMEGEGRLDQHGALRIEFDTRAALANHGDTDHRYLIEAEVTDPGRRLIEGEGSILVTRAAYFAHVEIDRGFYNQGDDVGIYVATQHTDGELFATRGELRVERVRYQGEGGATASEEPIEVLAVETRAEAPVRMTWRAPETGLYKFTFVGRDQAAREVRSSALAWVAGPGFHGRSYRFQGLELYTDKRTYQPGDTARILLNADHEGAHVLFSARAENGFLLEPRIIRLAGTKSTVIEIPITRGDMPNFFVEAVTVRRGELVSEAREVFVPPLGSELDVTVEGIKDEYRPGEDVELTVRTSAGGKPVAADVALAVFDQAVLYIQPDLTPNARAHFWALRRDHTISSTNNLDIKYGFGDPLAHPDQQAAWQLGSAARAFDQAETDWRSRDGTLRGADKLKNALDQTGPRQSAAVGSEVVSDTRLAKGETSKQQPESAPAAPPPPPPAEAREQRADDDRSKAGESNDPHGRPAVAARVRKHFADTAHFAPSVRTGPGGVAKVRFRLPDNLTTWQIKAIGLDAGTRVGEARATLLSSQKLLLRLQAPRFFRERDRVVLSAIVHNKYDRARKARVSLRVDQALLVPEGETTRTVQVPARGETRVDFWVAVKGEGTATVRMDVVAEHGRERDSDAKELSFPVLVHGLVKTVSQVGSIPMGSGPDERLLEFDVPADRRPEATRLEIRFSPSLAGGMLDALPYLLDYPYGCTEQTLSRFVPAVLARKALQQSGGLTLDQLQRANNLDPQELTPDGRHIPARSEHEHKRFDRQPVFDQRLMDRMIAAGVERLRSMQNPDGGWGWWGRDGSSRYTTAHVLDGLLDAQAADVALPPGMLERGKSALEELVAASLYRYEEHDWVSNDDAFAAYVMSRYQQRNEQLLGHLFERRRHLSTQGKLLAALAFHHLGQEKPARTLLDNAEQWLREDPENQTAWLETQSEGWWYWWNSDVETNAWYLRALDQMDARAGRDTERSRRAPGVVKWLLANRKNGYYWRSTRDSARVVAAFANHMQRSGEGEPDMDVEVLLDGQPLRAVHIDRKNFLTFDNAIRLEGQALATGRHTLTVRRKSGRGALYFNSYLSYFSTEEDVAAAGLEVRVTRTYHKLVRDDRETDIQGDRGQTVRAKQVAYRKVPLASGAEVASGDLILVELELESKNDYTFLAFEDPKPAGMEPVALRSGTTYGEAVANMELRDDRVVFFLRQLDRGTLRLSYRLRAEIPGQFHAMPTYGFGMYAPELATNSSEMRVSVRDAEP